MFIYIEFRKWILAMVKSAESIDSGEFGRCFPSSSSQYGKIRLFSVI